MLEDLEKRVASNPFVKWVAKVLTNKVCELPGLPGPKQVLQAGLIASTLNDGSQRPLQNSPTCSNPTLSCPAHVPSNVDTCCLNHPSGHFLLTQFWDASPALGADDTWTIHGLWPDLCSGGYEQFCSSRRSYNNISAILNSTAPSPDLLNYMKTHWLSLNGDNEHLWSHEWNKHGTCISTLLPSCYPDSNTKLPFLSVLDYFTQATSLYATLPTYYTLAAAHILPSTTQTYSLAALEAAIAPSHGDYPVTFRCTRAHELQQVWYHFSVRGPLRNSIFLDTRGKGGEKGDEFPLSKATVKQHFIPTLPAGAKSNCPATGIWYLPKSHRTPPSPPSATTPNPRPRPTSTGPPFSGRGHLVVHPINTSKSAPNSKDGIEGLESKGCLIRSGQWYRSGGCATYLAKPDVLPHPQLPLSSSPGTAAETLFTLSSLYAPCAVVPSTSSSTANDEFKCGTDLGVQSIFSASADGDGDGEDKKIKNVLTYKNSTSFFADGMPGRFEKATIYAGESADEGKLAVEIHWEAL